MLITIHDDMYLNISMQNRDSNTPLQIPRLYTPMGVSRAKNNQITKQDAKCSEKKAKKQTIHLQHVL